jgi:hypothetical protein
VFIYNKIKWESYVLINIVTRVRRRGDHPPFHNVSGKYKGDKEFLSFISGKGKGSHHLVFWSLETLTSLRDRVQILIA